jgi:drug/metabolite transporter (DMT)-like permease
VLFLVLFLNAVAAIGFPTTKILAYHIKPFFLSGLRLITSGIILFAFHFITTRSWVKYHKKDIWPFLKLSFLSYFLSFGLGLWVIQYVTAAKTSFMYNLVPFLSAILSYFYFSEKMTIKKIIGLTIGFLGFTPILLANGSSTGVEWYDLVLFVVVFTYAYGLIITRKMMRAGTYTATVITGTCMLVGGIFSLIFSPFIETNLVEAFTWYDALMFTLATLSAVISYSMLAYLLKRYTATFLTFAAFIMPLFVAFYSWFLLGEGVSWQFFVSTVAVLIGLYIFYQEELKQGYVTKM